MPHTSVALRCVALRRLHVQAGACLLVTGFFFLARRAPEGRVYRIMRRGLWAFAVRGRWCLCGTFLFFVFLFFHGGDGCMIVGVMVIVVVEEGWV